MSRGGGQRNQAGGQGGGLQHQGPRSKMPDKEKLASGKPAKEKTASGKAAKEKTAQNSLGGDEAYNKKQQQLANFQRQRDKKIAQADHLRQIAEKNGNANLAENADRMETQAMEEYARKVSQLEKFGVTDPALDLDGDGLVDPPTPEVDPLNNPAGGLQSLLPADAE